MVHVFIIGMSSNVNNIKPPYMNRMFLKPMQAFSVYLSILNKITPFLALLNMKRNNWALVSGPVCFEKNIKKSSKCQKLGQKGESTLPQVKTETS